MIVDDHQIIIDGIKSLLAKSKTHSIIAEEKNGKEAITLMQKHNIKHTNLKQELINDI